MFMVETGAILHRYRLGWYWFPRGNNVWQSKLKGIPSYCCFPSSPLLCVRVKCQWRIAICQSVFRSEAFRYKRLVPQYLMREWRYGDSVRLTSPLTRIQMMRLFSFSSQNSSMASNGSAGTKLTALDTFGRIRGYGWRGPYPQTNVWIVSDNIIR